MTGKRLLSRRGEQDQWPEVVTGSSVGLFRMGVTYLGIPCPSACHRAWENYRSANEMEEEITSSREVGKSQPERGREISPEFNSLFPKEQLMDYDKCPTALPQCCVKWKWKVNFPKWILND